MPPRSPLECPGVWEVRGYTGRDREGNPTQVLPTVHGTKSDARRIAAELTVKPSRNAGGRKVAQLLDEWLEQDAGTVSPWTGHVHRPRPNVGEVSRLRCQANGWITFVAWEAISW